MRKIRYNIAKNKKVDYMQFAIFSSLVVVISLIFIMLGISNLWSSDKRVRDQKEKMAQDRLMVDELEGKVQQYETDIRNFKTRWNQKISFANALISMKTVGLTQKLSILEEHLPEGVLVTFAGFNTENPSLIQVKIAASSLQRLIETYKSFAAYRPSVKNEIEEDGMFKANLVLRLNQAAPKPVTGEKKQEKPAKNDEERDQKELEDALL